MGVLNITPDSFSDGGQLLANSKIDADELLARAEKMMCDGAAILDVGGESTRPGAEPVSEQEELDRVLGAMEILVPRVDAIYSLDTSTASVMREGAARGAGLINDVRALLRDGALAAAAETGLPVCLMHMQGNPQTMQNNPAYSEVVAEVLGFLTSRVDACERAGIARERIILDPGFGFGKTQDHNLHLLNELGALKKLGLPILAGMSRKSMIGNVTGRPPEDRLAGSLAAALIAVQNGAHIIRVHDVSETVDVLAVYQALKEVSE